MVSGGFLTSGSRLALGIKSLLGDRVLHPLLRAQQAQFARFDPDRPLAEYEFTVLDTELTGLDTRKDEIVSVGAVRIRNLVIDPTLTFSSLVEPKTPMPKLSTLIHRITPAQVRGMPRLREVLPRLVEFCGDSLIVGHYVALDMGFLNRASRDILGGVLMNPCIDTLRMAQIYQEELLQPDFDLAGTVVSYTLRDLSVRYGLPVFPQHDALQDALQTAYLFLYLIRKMRRGKLVTLRDLYTSGRRWWQYL